MTSLINPSTSRLGISRGWVINYPITIASNYPICDKYRIQSYILSIDKYCNWVFFDRSTKIFYMKLFTIYTTVRFNTVGFSVNRKPRAVLDIVFYDFYLHVFGFKLNKRKLVYQCRKLLLGKKNSIKSFNKLNLKNTVFNFLMNYVKSRQTIRKCFNVHFSAFKSGIRKVNFKKGLFRIHKMFFPNLPITCRFVLIPYSSVVSAAFIARYIERKVRTGFSVNLVLSLVIRYLRNLSYVVGYRIICAGRFQRGRMAGYTCRHKGTYSYMRYNRKYILDFAKTTTILKTGMCGFKVWLCIYDKSSTKKDST